MAAWFLPSPQTALHPAKQHIASIRVGYIIPGTPYSPANLGNRKRAVARKTHRIFLFLQVPSPTSQSPRSSPPGPRFQVQVHRLDMPSSPSICGTS